jgi:hypothetical protein
VKTSYFGVSNLSIEMRGEADTDHKKNGGKRMPLAATGIDFNRILLSA